MPHCIVTKRSIHRWRYLIFLNFWLYSQSPFNLWGHVFYGWFLGEMEALTWKICWSSYCIFLCGRRLYETLGHSISKFSPYMGPFTNYVTHFLPFFDLPPTHSNVLAVILLITYHIRISICYAFADHPP